MPDRNVRDLRQAVEQLRLRAAAGDPQRRILLAGGVLLALGLGVIILGWRGASQTPYVFEQLPYLISGGVLGLAMVVVGGFLYFGYWVTRLVGEQRDQAARTIAALDQLNAALGEMASSNGSLVSAASAASSASRQAGSRRSGAATRVTRRVDPGATRTAGKAATNGAGRVVATPRGSLYHRPDCAVVTGREGVHTVRPEASGLEPCRLCNPVPA